MATDRVTMASMPVTLTNEQRALKAGVAEIC